MQINTELGRSSTIRPVARLNRIVEEAEVGNGATFTPSAEVGLRHERGRRRDGHRSRDRRGAALHRRPPHDRSPGAGDRCARGVGLRGMGAERGHRHDAEPLEPGPYPPLLRRGAIEPRRDLWRLILLSHLAGTGEENGIDRPRGANRALTYAGVRLQVAQPGAQRWNSRHRFAPNCRALMRTAGSARGRGCASRGWGS